VSDVARPRLTVCMIVRNEAENLRRALASVRAVADELVVVDTGSSDDSAAVAREMGARVGQFAWCDDFAAARNAALALAAGAWVLSLDADEELDPASLEPLRRLVAADPDGPTVVKLLSLSTFDSGEVDRSWVPRLASNHPDVRFVRPIHEQFANVAEGELLTFAAADVLLHHRGYHRAERVARGKGERNLRLLLDQIARAPDSAVDHYYLGAEYFAQGRYREAVDLYEQWIGRFDAGLPRDAAIRSRYNYAAALLGLARPAEAARVAASEAERLASPLLHLQAASGCLQAQDPAARHHADEAIRLAASEALMQPAVVAAMARVMLGDLARRDGDRATAAAAYATAIDEAPGLSHGHIRLAELRAEEGDFEGASASLHRLLEALPDEIAVHVRLSGYERRLGRLQEAVDRLSAILGRTPENLALRIELAETLYQAGEHSIGAEVLAAAIEIPQLQSSAPAFRGRYYDRLGFGLVQAGHLEPALQAYQAALRADPSLPGPRAVLAGYQEMVAQARAVPGSGVPAAPSLA